MGFEGLNTEQCRDHLRELADRVYVLEQQTRDVEYQRLRRRVEVIEKRMDEALANLKSQTK